MDYFTDPIVIVASALHELQYASQNGGAKKVRIGLETNCLCPDASTESFFNWNEETRLSDLSYAIDYIYEMCGNIPCFGGIALHSLPFFNPQDSDDENACSECIEQHPSLKIYKGCPVDFIITDPAGMQVGRGGGNIPGASYSVFEISETDSGAIITIPSPLPGIYLIGVIPWPSALPTDTYSITALWDNKPTILALDVPIAQIPDDGYIFSTLTSANISGTTSASGQGLAGVSIGLFNLQGELYASVATDGSGYYEFEEVPNGDYFIDCQPPLGFSLISEPMMPLCIVGLNQEINFELQEGASGRYLDLWTWKMCLNDLRNNGPLPDIFSVADANRWAGAIFEHYYSRGDGHAIQINDVTCTDNPSRALSFDDLVRVMVDVNGPSVGHQTQIKLLTNILNVASGRMSQRAIVSVDGATASQGIQYFSHLYQTENRDSLVVAYRCLQYMYSKRMIPAGVIPLTIPNIMYRLEMESEALPEEFSLSQSHPNPFNAQCIIDFALPSASHVRLEIFDILGRRVSSLIDEDKQAGYYQVAWDAKDRPSGMYFYRIEAGEFIETKKMMLLK
jgi:hypothetical protein